MVWGGGGQNVGTIQVTPWAIIYVRPGPLVRYGTGVNHFQMWLNIYQISQNTVPINQQEG